MPYRVEEPIEPIVCEHCKRSIQPWYNEKFFRAVAFCIVSIVVICALAGFGGYGEQHNSYCYESVGIVGACISFFASVILGGSSILRRD